MNILESYQLVIESTINKLGLDLDQDNPDWKGGHVGIPIKAYNAAANPMVSGDVLTKALQHANPHVRVNALYNPNITHDHLRMALNDKWDRVRETAKKHKLFPTLES